MNKLILIAIALVVVVAGAIMLGGNKSSQPKQTELPVQTQSEPQNTNQELTTIILDETGFSPKEVNIKQGTKVMWINKTDSTATVSSDDHPTHQIYPKLNLGQFDSGSSHQLVFDEKGTYGYHNHLDASQTGTVIVE